MKPGNNFFFILTFFFVTFESNIFAEDKITSSPLINLSELKPSFEDIEDLGPEDKEDRGSRIKASEDRSFPPPQVLPHRPGSAD